VRSSRVAEIESAVRVSDFTHDSNNKDLVCKADLTLLETHEIAVSSNGTIREPPPAWKSTPG